MASREELGIKVADWAREMGLLTKRWFEMGGVERQRCQRLADELSEEDESRIERLQDERDELEEERDSLQDQVDEAESTLRDLGVETEGKLSERIKALCSNRESRG